MTVTAPSALKEKGMLKEPPQLRAIGYCRVASKDKDTNNKLEKQQNKVRYHMMNEDLEFATSFNEIGQAGKALMEAYDYCNALGDIYYLVVSDFTRIARDKKILQAWIDKFAEIEVEVVEAHEPYKVNLIPSQESVDYRLPCELSQYVSEQFAKLQSDCVKRAMLDRVKKGYSVTSPPLGYRTTKTKGLYEPSDFGRGIGVAMQSVARDGTAFLPNAIDITRYLVARNTDRKLTRSQVLRVLCNPYYAGYLNYQGNMYKGLHEPLITHEQHEAILKAIQNASHKTVKKIVVK